MQEVEGSSPFSRFREVLISEPFLRLQLALSTELGGLLLARVPIGCQYAPAGKQCEGLGDGAADGLFERLDALLSHVDDLLIDAHRERRVGVSEQVHRAPRRQVDLREDRGEGASEGMRCAVRDLALAASGEQLVGALDGGLHDGAPDVVDGVALAVAVGEHGVVRTEVELGLVFEQEVDICPKSRQRTRGERLCAKCCVPVGRLCVASEIVVNGLARCQRSGRGRVVTGTLGRGDMAPGGPTSIRDATVRR